LCLFCAVRRSQIDKSWNTAEILSKINFSIA
jgi:hypothetical protein